MLRLRRQISEALNVWMTLIGSSLEFLGRVREVDWAQGGVMDGTLLTALVSGTVAFDTVTITQTLTYFFSRKRDHEADWRKMKLEHYKEYLLALSRVVGRDSEPSAQRRYADASNSLALVAPPNLLAALYNFQYEISEGNVDHSATKAQFLLSVLMRSMRKYCQPQAPKDNQGFVFRILDIPSDNLVNRKGRFL